MESRYHQLNKFRKDKLSYVGKAPCSVPDLDVLGYQEDVTIERLEDIALTPPLAYRDGLPGGEGWFALDAEDLRQWQEVVEGERQWRLVKDTLKGNAIHGTDDILWLIYDDIFTGHCQATVRFLRESIRLRVATLSGVARRPWKRPELLPPLSVSVGWTTTGPHQLVPGLSSLGEVNLGWDPADETVLIRWDRVWPSFQTHIVIIFNEIDEWGDIAPRKIENPALSMMKTTGTQDFTIFRDGKMFVPQAHYWRKNEPWGVKSGDRMFDYICRHMTNVRDMTTFEESDEEDNI